MIVFPDRRLLILTPPHTASRAIHYACCEQLRAIWRDGPTAEAGAKGKDMVRETRVVKAGDSLTLDMAPGGGFAIRLAAPRRK